MKIRFITLLLIVPMLFCCQKQPADNQNEGNNGQEQTTPPEPEDKLPPQIKNGDVILATNANVDKFITEVTYKERDYGSTHIRDEAYTPTCPGKDDVPPKYTIRWEPDPDAGAPVVRLWEDDGWSREYVDPDIIENYYVIITNLRPGTNYHFEVKAGEKVLTSGAFQTTGHIHQVIFSSVRNARDLGGWKTKDGTKAVKFRKIYRGGRMSKGELWGKGKRDLAAEGIKAQLDLRGHTSKGVQEYLNPEDSPLNGLQEDYAFCAPSIEEGYIQLVRDDQEKAAQCMKFIMQCVKEDKPVYFHCSLGRDRTGTVAMMVLGILGVDEGDISKEYEITQFAPHGWATSDGEGTKMTRCVDYKGAASYIWNNFSGADGSFAEGMEKYFIEKLGITKAEIDEFRNLMLENI